MKRVQEYEADRRARACKIVSLCRAELLNDALPLLYGYRNQTTRKRLEKLIDRMATFIERNQGPLTAPSLAAKFRRVGLDGNNREA